MEKVHSGMQGDATVIESGGVIEVKSGGRVNVQSGGVINLEAGALLEMAGSAETPAVAEINTLAGLLASVTMTTTPATGTCAVQLTFKDSAGVALDHKTAGLLYFSTVGGTAIAAGVTNATLTNGAIQELVAGKVDLFITSAAGLLGFTLTSTSGSYYASLVLPNGRVITTGDIVIN